MFLFFFTTTFVMFFYSSPKETLAACCAVMFVTFVVKLWARFVFGYHAPYGTAYRTIVVATCFGALASFVLAKYAMGIKIVPGTLVVVAAYWVAYSCGFRLGLRARWGLSIPIAAVAAGLSVGMLRFLKVWYF